MARRGPATDRRASTTLDPGNPAVVRYTTDVVIDLLRRYDVDGIHLDQVRYYEGQPLRWGYNPTSVARFDQQFGRDPAQPEPTDPDWIAWRRDQVTALVRRVFLEARAIRPGHRCHRRGRGVGQGPAKCDDWEKQAPFAAVLQDWRAWLQEGIVDYVHPDGLLPRNGDQADWFDTWTRWQTRNPGAHASRSASGSYLNDADGVARPTRPSARPGFTWRRPVQLRGTDARSRRRQRRGPRVVRGSTARRLRAARARARLALGEPAQPPAVC